MTPLKFTGDVLLIDPETGTYPVTMAYIASKFSDTSFPETPLMADILKLGFAIVNRVTIPVGDVVVEGKPVLQTDGWYQVWETRSWTEQELQQQLDDLKKAARDKVMEVRQNDFDVGMPYDYNGVTYHIQLRDGDRPNLLTQNLNARGVVGKGVTADTLLPFQTYENITLMLPPDQMIDMTNRALDTAVSIYQASWAIKTQITAAATAADIPEIPSTFITP